MSRWRTTAATILWIGGTLPMAAQVAQSGFKGFHQIPSHLYAHWKACGNRIEKPGAERIVGAGTIVRRATPNAVASAPANVAVVLEFPGRARVEEAGQTSPAAFNVDAPVLGKGQDVEDLLELLVEDFSDGFFRVAISEGSMRWVGGNFRSLDEPGRYFDIVEASYRTKVRGSAAEQVKRYYFDSSTKLLAKVVYRQANSRGVVNIESEFGDWTRVNGQAIPRRMVRREGGVEMLRIQLPQVATTAAVNDGSFGGGK